MTNIASGTSTQTLACVKAGAVQCVVVSSYAVPSRFCCGCVHRGFVHLLQASDGGVRHQALWGLANIAGDSAEMRDVVLQSGSLGCSNTP